MNHRRSKKNYITNTDRRIDIGPAGRNIFISRDKQAQDRSAQHIRTLMHVVIALVVLALVAGIGIFAVTYLVPYFHSEFSIEGAESNSPSESLLSEAEPDVPFYDESGLPVYKNEFNLFSISAASPAKSDFVPEITKVNGIEVQSEIADATRLLVNTAKEDGLALEFSRGYISYEKQKDLFEKKVKEIEKNEKLTVVMAKTEAKKYVPMAGECDDQSGMCITVNGKPETFEKSQTFSWLKSNMGKYGFVFRYPQYREEATGHVMDYTVIRYVGTENAQAMQQRAMCLEEYVAYLANQ